MYNKNNDKLKSAIFGLLATTLLATAPALADTNASLRSTWEVSGEFDVGVRKLRRTGSVRRLWTGSGRMKIRVSENLDSCEILVAETAGPTEEFLEKFNCVALQMPSEDAIENTSKGMRIKAFGDSPSRNLNVKIEPSELERLFRYLGSKVRISIDDNKVFHERQKRYKWTLNRVVRKGQLKEATINNQISDYQSGPVRFGFTKRVVFLKFKAQNNYLYVPRDFYGVAIESPNTILGNYKMAFDDGAGSFQAIQADDLKVTWHRDGTECQVHAAGTAWACRTEALPTSGQMPFITLGNRKLIMKISTDVSLKMLKAIANEGSLAPRANLTAFLSHLADVNRLTQRPFELEVQNSSGSQIFSDGVENSTFPGRVKFDYTLNP